MNISKLKQIIQCGETSTVQFKECFSSQKQLATEMIAFANSKGGNVIFGVEDKTGEIRGLSYNEIQVTARELGNAANEQVRPIIYLQTDVVIVDEKPLLIATINEGINKPYKDLNGNIWVKQGADKRRVTENSEILRLFHQSYSYAPDEEPVMSTSENDLDIRLLDAYIRKTYNKEKEEFGIPFDQLLRNLRIQDESGALTLSGLLYFGKHPQRFKPSFMIKAVAFNGNEIAGTQYRDSKDIEGTIPELFEQTMAFLKSNLHSVQAGQSVNSIGKLEIPEIALEEMLQNSLVHREYIKTAAIRVLIFDNRVEIISPGALPDGLTVDDIKLGNSYQRNQQIAGFCAKTMVYRGLGSGVIRAINEGADIEFINSESGNQFTTVVYRNIGGGARFSEQIMNQSMHLDVVVPRSSPACPQSVPSLSPACPQLVSVLSLACPQLEKLELEKAVKVVCSCNEYPQSMQELLVLTGSTNRTRFRQNILKVLLNADFVETMIKDVINSPRQTYKLTKKGKLLLTEAIL